jgi:type I restriction enzyme, S subunit
MTQTKPTVTSSRTGKWKPYPAYKESGVEWLGEIPEHWEVKRLKYVAPASTAKLIEKPDDLPYLGLENIESKTGRLLLDTPVENVESTVGIFDKGNVLFGKLRPYLAKVVCIDFRGVCTTELLVLQPNDVVNGKFLFYRLLSEDFVKLVNSLTYGTKMPRVSSEQIGNLAVQLPPFPEQNAIITYLDRETARISALIAKKERLVELLQEKRAALISHAVTKGLDPTVPMKDAGVEWIGEIPAHWGVKRVRDITELLQTGPFGSQLHSSDYSPYGIPVINPSHLKDGYIYPDWDCAVNEETLSRLLRHELRKGDIVFARRGEMGRCALVTEKEAGWLCGTGSLLMRPRVTLAAPAFLNKVLSTEGVKDWLLLESVGSTMDNLNSNILSRIPLPIPPLSEQYTIVNYLEGETAKIDALISRIREGIEKLKEYSAALISAAVTGKIDVREEIPLPGDRDL